MPLICEHWGYLPAVTGTLRVSLHKRRTQGKSSVASQWRPFLFRLSCYEGEKEMTKLPAPFQILSCLCFPYFAVAPRCSRRPRRHGNRALTSQWEQSVDPHVSGAKLETNPEGSVCLSVCLRVFKRLGVVKAKVKVISVLSPPGATGSAFSDSRPQALVEKSPATFEEEMEMKVRRKYTQNAGMTQIFPKFQ